MDRQSKRMGGNWRMCGGLVAMMSFAAGACVAQQMNPFPNQTSEGTIEPAPCPPDSFTYTNNTGNSQTVMYTCSDNTSKGVPLANGDSIIFEKNGCGHDAPSGCVPCGVVKVYVDGALLFSCDMLKAYWDAYGIDLAAIGFTSTEANTPKMVYNADGDVIRMRHWAIPVINEDGEFVNWEFTTIEPHFSVVDGEVVIRDNRDRVIGGRTGITLGK